MFTNFIVNAAQGILVGVISLPFIIVIHELGHLLCGKLSGYQFISLRLLLFQWTKNQDGKIKFSRVSSLFGIGGQCLMIPKGEEKDFRYLLYNLGGGLANVIVGFALIVPIFLSGHPFMRWLFIAGIVSIFIAAINLIPIAFGGFPNDAKNILEARKSDDARLAFYRVLQAHGEMALGKHLSDLDEDFFKISEDTDVNNFLVAQSVLFHAAYLEEKKNHKESYQKLLLLEKAELPSVYKAQVLLALLFDELVYQGNAESLERAKERWALHKNDKRILEIVEEKNPALMIPYAAKVAFIDSDLKAARKLLSEAKKLIPTLQNFGMEQLAKQMVEQLENRLPEDVFDGSIGETDLVENIIEPSDEVQEIKSESEAFRGVLDNARIETPVKGILETTEEVPAESLFETTEEVPVESSLEMEIDSPEIDFPIEKTPTKNDEGTLLFEEDSDEPAENTSNNSSFDDIMEQFRKRR